MTTDLTFITNQEDKSLLDRFKVLLGSNTRFFDCLVGYFYASGFYQLTEHFESTERVRILIGISTNPETYKALESARQGEFKFSHAETKEQFGDQLTGELSTSPDSHEVAEGVHTFIKWINSKKLEIRAYPSAKLHAKLYIMTFNQGDRDLGRVITGSSNFTEAGLRDNLEFNVELKSPSDYKFALEKFNELWEQGVDVSEKFVETINDRTWLNDSVSPYDLYLKFLYEYFKKDLRHTEDMANQYTPHGYRRLEYQEQAVASAKRVLEEYGGVFLSDVVGLGKTYISALLASQLGDGRSLVIAPPVLLDKNNPGSWTNVFSAFNVRYDCESIGKIEDLAKRGTEQYKNVFLDEAHRHRTESTQTYEYLAQICRGKRVILVSATPLNNSPRDILSQLKLFQKGKKSTIPNLPDLDGFFKKLEKRLKNVDRKRDAEQYRQIVRENAKEVREKILQHLMIRRTRSEVIKYFGDDLKRQKLKFPEVVDPKGIFYQLDSDLDRVFFKTIQLIGSSNMKYARYKPAVYLKEGVSQFEQQQQENLGRFMKILLVKRLDSSFHAFRKTVQRFIYSYDRFIEMFKKGHVFIGKDYVNKVFDLVDEDRFEEIEAMEEEGKIESHSTDEFRPEFIDDLNSDLQIFREIHQLWEPIKSDPKVDELIKRFSYDEILRKPETKPIIFTESKETADYLSKQLSIHYEGKILNFSGQSGESAREKVIENFDAKCRNPKDDFRILVTTDVLAEGVNLHRSNVVINYDIPWNPTRMIQRVGRINRVDTPYDTIHTYNFFPTEQSDDQIKLADAAKAKIEAFIHMLGADAKLLTDDEEITSHDLFARLTSKKTVTGEDENELSELKYFQVIKEIRDSNLDLFDRIKRLPRKARSARALGEHANSLLSYMRKSPLEKFYLATLQGSRELDFFQAAELFECSPGATRTKLGKEFYELLEKNKQEFDSALVDIPDEEKRKGGADNTQKILRILKSNQVRLYKGFVEEDEDYLRLIIRLLEEGAFPSTLLKRLKNELENVFEAPQILAVLKTNISDEFLKPTIAEEKAAGYGPTEVILSELFTED